MVFIAAARNALPWLLDEIARLTAEAEEATKLSRLSKAMWEDAEAEIARLTAENAALREGLKPFAAEAAVMEDFFRRRGEDELFGCALKATDLRRAARLTEPKETA